MKKILSWEDARALAEDTRRRGGVVVSTNGCFDLLHKGHVQYLEQARALGDVLIVGINADASVRRLKGPERPLTPAEDRGYVLASLACVDGVCIFDEDTPENWLRSLQPQIHVKGADWEGKKIPEESLLASWGGRVHYAPYLEGYSTTRIIEKSKGQSS